MLSRLSHPLAFATAPLDGTIPEYGGESFFVVGEEGGGGMGDTIVPITRSMAATMLQYPQSSQGQKQQRGQGRALQGQEQGQDDVPKDRKTLEEYAVENRQLKIAVDQLSKTVASYKEVRPFPRSVGLLTGCLYRPPNPPPHSSKTAWPTSEQSNTKPLQHE